MPRSLQRTFEQFWYFLHLKKFRTEKNVIKCPSNKNKLLLQRRKNRPEMKAFLFIILGTKKKLSFLECFYVSAVAVYFNLMGILWHSFQSDVFKGKKYENCSNVLWRPRGTKLKCNLIKSDFQRVREVCFFLSIFGEVVLLRCVV